MQLALKLLHERRGGPSSRLAAYVGALPQSYSTPVSWSEDKLAALRYPHLQQQVLGRVLAAAQVSGVLLTSTSLVNFKTQ